ARCILLAQHPHLTAWHRRANQQQAQAVAAEIGLLACAEDITLFLRRLVEREEVGQGHGKPFEQLFQRADRRADAVEFNQGDGAVGDTAASGQLSLGHLVAFPH
nr:hypothetical protein [Tanacetum cinerariifolium]